MFSNLELNVYDWLLIAVLGLNLHWLLAKRLSRMERIWGLKIGSWGPVIMIRTTRWLTLIDRLSSPRRLWKLSITAGIPLVVLGMASFLAFFLVMTLEVMRTPPEPSVYTAPRRPSDTGDKPVHTPLVGLDRPLRDDGGPRVLPRDPLQG